MAERQNIQTAQNPQAEEVQSIDLMELMYWLISSWKLIACLAVVFALAAGLYTTWFVTPQYKATSTIYVLSRKDSAINMSDLQIGSALTEDYIKVFEMWEVHEQVISNLGLSYTYSEMASKLSVVNDSDTRMLDISFTSPDPQEAAAVANEYAEVVCEYIADRMSTDKPNIMSEALVPSNPVSPSKTRNVMLGFLLGLFGGVAYVVLKMLIDDTYKTAEDIRKYTGLPTLSVVPVEDVDDERKSAHKGGAARRNA